MRARRRHPKTPNKMNALGAREASEQRSGSHHTSSLPRRPSSSITMGEPAVEPNCASIPASGGTSTHQINNPTEARLAFKIKTSDNALYKVNPVFGFVEPGQSAPVEVTRSGGPPKDDKLIVQLAPVAPECADPKEPFSAGGTFPELPVTLSAA